MSSQTGRVPTRRSVTRRPRVYRMAPSRRGKTAQSGKHIENDPNCRLLLSNLGPDVDKTAIDEKFGEFGKVNKVVIHCNTSAKRIGTGEVWMTTNRDAIKSKAQLNATDIFNDGRIIRIEKTKLLTKVSSFWKSVYKYVSLMKVKIPEETEPEEILINLTDD